MKTFKTSQVAQKVRLERLLNTIDKTVQSLTEDSHMMDEKDLYSGFSKETIDRWNKQVDEEYDAELVAQARSKLKNTSKKEWTDNQKEMEALNHELAENMERYFQSRGTSAH